MELKGTVLNVVDFGAFVDIGLKDSGLVHISQLANRYVKSPHDVVSVGDVVTVWVLGVDQERKRVSLTMVEPGTERPRGRPGRRGRRGRRSPWRAAAAGARVAPPREGAAVAGVAPTPPRGGPPERRRAARRGRPRTGPARPAGARCARPAATCPAGRAVAVLDAGRRRPVSTGPGRPATGRSPAHEAEAPPPPPAPLSQDAIRGTSAAVVRPAQAALRDAAGRTPRTRRRLASHDAAGAHPGPAAIDAHGQTESAAADACEAPRQR